VTRGGGNNSATTTPITNIQIKLLLSSNLSTARLFSGENKSVAKINVLHTVLSRPAKSRTHRHSHDYHQEQEWQ